MGIKQRAANSIIRGVDAAGIHVSCKDSACKDLACKDSACKDSACKDSALGNGKKKWAILDLNQ